MKSYHTDEKRVKTKKRTKSVKSYSLMRQEELERQCEEFFISLDNVDVEGESQEEVDDCDVLTPSLEEEHEEVEAQEFESEVRVEETESLKDSSLNGARKEGNVASMLLCSCQGCRKESQGCKLEEPLGFEVSHGVTMMGTGEQLGLAVGKGINGAYSSSYLKVSNLLGCETLCPVLGRPVLGGKIYNLLTPHYHCNMLVRLMERLVDMNVAVILFEGENNLFHLHSSHLAVVKLCCVLVVENFFGLNCLSLTMIKLNLLCPNDGVILLSTWESIRGTKREKQKYFYVQIPEVNDVMEYHGVWLDGMLEGHFQCQLDGIWGIHSHCCVESLFAGCGKSEHLRNLFEPNTTGFRRLNQWVTSVWDYDLLWFKWLIMMTVENGVVSYLWNCGGIVLMCVGEEKGSEAAVTHRCSFANNDSSCKRIVGSQLLVTVSMQLWGCHGEMIKVQSKAAQSIGKWFHIAELNAKSKGDRLKHIADAQGSERTTEIERFRLKDLKHKPIIREAIKMGMRTEYQVFVPLHSNTINCKMKSTQSCSHKIPSTPLILLSKLMGIISFDAREIELVMKMLKWGAQNAGIKGSIAEPLVLKAKSVKTIKSVIEWMIAWENKSVLSSGDKQCSMTMSPWN